VPAHARVCLCVCEPMGMRVGLCQCARLRCKCVSVPQAQLCCYPLLFTRPWRSWHPRFAALAALAHPPGCRHTPWCCTTTLPSTQTSSRCARARPWLCSPRYPPFLRVMVLNLCPGMQLHYTFWLLLTLVPTATDAPTATDSPAADIAAGAVGTPDAGSDGAARAGVVVWPHRRPPGFPSRQLRRRSFPPDPRGLFPGRSLRRWRGQPAHGGG